MNNYEDWSRLVAKNLKGEADLIAAIEKDELDDAAAKQAFIHAMLEPFLPENYAIGSGRIVDAFGTYSEHLDIVVYNRDFPRIGLRGTHSVYLYESVLAAIEVKAKLIRKTFFEALDNSASLAQLNPNIEKEVLLKLAKKNGMTRDQNREFVHTDPLRSARFQLIGRPPVFVFAFSGIKTSSRQLEENINLWLEHRQQEALPADMKSLPAVIATQGCFAWRNAAPLALSNRRMMGIGTDAAPIRLIVLQLLHLLNRKLNVRADGYGLKPNLNTYLRQFSAPEFERTVGRLTPQLNATSEEKPAESEHSSSAPVAAAAAIAAAQVAPAASQDESLPEQIAGDSQDESLPDEIASEPADQPLPPAQFAQPLHRPVQPASEPEKQSEQFAPSLQSSAPSLQSEQSVQSPARRPAGGTGEISVVPPKPPLDIPLFAEEENPEHSASGAFSSSDTMSKHVDTLVQPREAVDSAAPAPASNGADQGEEEGARASTDAFIARVKEQMSNPEPFPQLQPEKETEEADPFSSTIPQ